LAADQLVAGIAIVTRDLRHGDWLFEAQTANVVDDLSELFPPPLAGIQDADLFDRDHPDLGVELSGHAAHSTFRRAAISAK
jgi:hypothetical protein